MRILIKFTGNLVKTAGVFEVNIDVPLEESIRLQTVKREIESRIGKAMLYTVLLNGRALQTYKNPEGALSDCDVVTVVPVTIGG